MRPKQGESTSKYVARFKRPAFPYLNLTQYAQDSSDSQMFAMSFFINQTFSKILSAVINNTSQTNTWDWIISIKSARLNEIICVMKDPDKSDEKKVKNCISTAEAAGEIQLNHQES